MARLVWQLLPIGDFENIGAIKTMNEHHQRFFFSEGAMAFFNSRIEPKVYSGCVFVTSESPQQLHPLGRTDDQRRSDRSATATGMGFHTSQRRRNSGREVTAPQRQPAQQRHTTFTHYRGFLADRSANRFHDAYHRRRRCHI